jgi:Tol biopolymer transport system component
VQALVKIAPLQIISTDSLKVVRTLPLVGEGYTFAFSADGKSVFYDAKTGADTTIWRQPLDAAAAVKVASLPGKNVFWIRPSPDGKKLGLVISTATTEAVLIHDVR